MQTSLSENRLIFLINTGSQISLIKAEKIHEAKVNTLQSIEIIGIADSKTVRSLGITQAHLKFENRLVTHKFHVMHQNIHLRPDGIIGADFLIKYATVLDMGGQNIIMKEPECFMEVPQTDATHLNSVKIKGSSQMNNSENDEEYSLALNNYLQYEKNFIYTIKITKKTDPFFYDKLDDSKFQEFKKMEFQEHIYNDSMNLFSLYDTLSLNPFKIVGTNEIKSNDLPLTDPIERQDYLMKTIDLSDCPNLK